jgi:short-subunit dehydrogenase
MKSVVIGGTAGLGRELAAQLALRGDTLLITGRDQLDLDACVSDLQLRYGANVQGIVVEALDQENYLKSLKLTAFKFGEINNLFLPIGASNTWDDGNQESAELQGILSSNFLSVVLAVQAFQPHFKKTERVEIVSFSSIATIRGRSVNVIYAASKRALESYFESLKISYLKTNVSIKCYRIGYLDTHQSYGKNLLFPKKDSKKAANYLIRTQNGIHSVNYYPRYWRVLAFFIQLLPPGIYKKIST